MAVAKVEVPPNPARRRRSVQRGKRRKVDVHPPADGLNVALLPHPQANECPVSGLSAKRREARPFGVSKACLQHPIVNRHDPLDVATDLRVRDGSHHPVAGMGEAEVEPRNRIKSWFAERILCHRQRIGVNSPFCQHLPQEKPDRNRTATVGNETKRITFAPPPRRKTGIRRLIRSVIRQDIGDSHTPRIAFRRQRDVGCHTVTP